MGFFSDIIGQVSEDVRRGEKRAENWDIEEICHQIQRTSNTKYKMGYANAIKKKSEELSDSELCAIYDRAWDYRDKDVLIGLFPVMRGRGLAEKDDNGKVRRCY